MLRELAQRATGALYSSLDADSEGHEGRFYVWDRDAVRAALDAAASGACSRRASGSIGAPNFEGQWHLAVRAEPGRRSPSGSSCPSSRCARRSRSAQRKLFELRAARVRPALDDKVLTSWNALAIGGLAIAARCLGRDDYAAAATAALRLPAPRALARRAAAAPSARAGRRAACRPIWTTTRS